MFACLVSLNLGGDDRGGVGTGGGVGPGDLMIFMLAFLSFLGSWVRRMCGRCGTGARVFDIIFPKIIEKKKSP